MRTGVRSNTPRDEMQQNEVLRPYLSTLFPPNSGPKRFLDLSCGSRTDIKRLVEEEGHTWIGVDQVRLPGVVTADVHMLPFRNNEFDIVYSAATFEHYYNPWQVAREVARVLRPGGLFCGLIAFIQPWHGDSYYHFTHLGTEQMLREAGFEILDIRAGDTHGLPYLIKSMFDTPFSSVGKAISSIGTMLAGFRRYFYPYFVRLIYFGNLNESEKRLQFLRDDALRYAASILFLSQKM
jgi:ubiquinone/menaquinone biosynthesis C-methylase UbiE